MDRHPINEKWICDSQNQNEQRENNHRNNEFHKAKQSEFRNSKPPQVLEADASQSNPIYSQRSIQSNPSNAFQTNTSKT